MLDKVKNKYQVESKIDATTVGPYRYDSVQKEKTT